MAWQRATTGEKRLQLKQVNNLEIEILRGMEWELVWILCLRMCCVRAIRRDFTSCPETKGLDVHYVVLFWGGGAVYICMCFVDAHAQKKI